MPVNKVILIGNLGRDPEVRATPSGQTVCNFSIATSEKFTGRDGTQREQTEWHNVVAWAKLADACGQARDLALLLRGLLEPSDLIADRLLEQPLAVA